MSLASESDLQCFIYIETLSHSMVHLTDQEDCLIWSPNPIGIYRPK
jgi:hypothetical protein